MKKLVAVIALLMIAGYAYGQRDPVDDPTSTPIIPDCQSPLPTACPGDNYVCWLATDIITRCELNVGWTSHAAGSGGTECVTSSCDLNTSTTLNTQGICLADGTNCPASTDDQTAAEVASTPTGSIAATNVDAAIAELEAEHLRTEVDGSTTNEINTVQGDGDTPTSGLAISIDGGTGITTAVVGDVLTITGHVADGTGTDDQTAAEVTSTATGSIVATDVDSAIAELEAEHLRNVAEDTTPQLGGNLDVQTSEIVATTTNNIVLNPASGAIRFTDLTNCDTIDTDANGDLSCGSDETGAGSGAFSDAGDPAVLNSTGKDVEIGPSGGPATEPKLQVVGDTAAQVQFAVSGHATQSADIMVVCLDDTWTADTNETCTKRMFRINAEGAVSINRDETITTDDDIFFIRGDGNEIPMRVRPNGVGFSRQGLTGTSPEAAIHIGPPTSGFPQIEMEPFAGCDSITCLTDEYWMCADTDDDAILVCQNGTVAEIGAGGIGDVSAAAVMTDNAVVRGDGGAKGVQDSGVAIDDSDNMTGVNDLTIGGTLDTGESAAPTISFKDSSFGTADVEAKIVADANADNNGEISLQVETSADTFTEVLAVESNSGTVSGTFSGKVTRNNQSVSDDDCTGEQGSWWYDTTDSAFEFCNANSGAPTAIGGSGGITNVVGDCTQANCFDNSASSGTILTGAADGPLSIAADTDVIIRLDEDNDGSESLEVVNGGGTTIMSLNESGTLSLASGLIVPSGSSLSLTGATITYGVLSTLLEMNRSIEVNDSVYLAEQAVAEAVNSTYGQLWVKNDGELYYTGDDGVDKPLTGTQVKSMYWPAGAMEVDGTNCGYPSSVELGGTGGPPQLAITCTDNAGSYMYGHVVMPDGWDGLNSLLFEISAVNDNASPSGTHIVKFDAMCVTPGSDAIGTTWGTAISATITFDTQWRAETATTTSVTPNGSACAGGDLLYWRGLVNTGATTQESDIHHLGVKMEYGWVPDDS